MAARWDASSFPAGSAIEGSRRVPGCLVREAAEGPWPSPKVDQIEAVAGEYAAEWPAWGHRKIAAMMRTDGYPLLLHVRTRVRSPQTNGVVERFFGTLKYEHL
jgi:hypothetical protein